MPGGRFCLSIGKWFLAEQRFATPDPTGSRTLPRAAMAVFRLEKLGDSGFGNCPKAFPKEKPRKFSFLETLGDARMWPQI
jgi:hypothetical protein